VGNLASTGGGRSGLLGAPIPVSMNPELLAQAKSLGFSDRQIAHLTGRTEDEVRALRKRLGLVPSYRLVDTCAAEFEAYTPYYYSTYDRGDDEVKPQRGAEGDDPRRRPEPDRAGHRVRLLLRACGVRAEGDGFETIMVNSNPETVSTDYDTSDKLFFEPLTLEDVLHIYERERCWGAIAQFGGQTPLNLALGLQKNGVNIIGTTPQSIEVAEDRKLFAAMLDKLGIPQPPNGIATNESEALEVAKRLAYPVLVRPVSCSAVAPCRSSSPTPSSSTTCGSPSRRPRSGPCWSTSSWRTRPRWTSTASRTSGHFEDPTRGPS
jgi:carbamoyl-phosphate synthase large subunit